MNMQPALDWVDVGSRRLLHNHGNFATEGSPKSRLCPILFEWLHGFFIVHSTIDSTVHDGPLNSIEQQPDQMSHWSQSPSFKGWYIFKIVLFTQVHLYTRIVCCTFLSDQCVFGLSRRRGGGGGGVSYNYSDSRERSDSKMSRIETCSNLITPATRLLSVLDLLPRVVVEIGSTIIKEENQPFNLSRCPKAVFYIYTNILHLKIILKRNILMNMFQK